MRRKVLAALTLGLASIACGRLPTLTPTPTPSPAPTPTQTHVPAPLPTDLFLRGSKTQVGAIVGNEVTFSMLRHLATNPGEALRIGFEGVGGPDVLTLSFPAIGEGNSRRLTLRLDSTGETKVLSWHNRGAGQFFVRLLDHQNRLEKEVPLEGLEDVRTTEDFLRIGVIAVAIALAVWLGAKVGAFLLSAIAFLALVALTLGAIFIVLAVVQALLKRFEVDDQKLQEFFRKGAENLERFLDQIADSIAPKINPPGRAV